MPRTEPRVSAPVVASQSSDIPVYPYDRPLEKGETYKTYRVDGRLIRMIVRPVVVDGITRYRPAEDLMDGVMIRAFMNWSQPKFYAVSCYGNLPGEIVAFVATRAEATGTKKAHSTRKKNGAIVVDTAAFFAAYISSTRRVKNQRQWDGDVAASILVDLGGRDGNEFEYPPDVCPTQMANVPAWDPTEEFEVLIPAVQIRRRVKVMQTIAAHFPEAEDEPSALDRAYDFIVTTSRCCMLDFLRAMDALHVTVETIPDLTSGDF